MRLSNRHHFEVKEEVSDRTIRWDYLLEVKQMYQVEVSDGITIKKQLEEVLSNTIKWTYHFEVKAEVSDGTIRWEYLSKVKQRYQA